MANKPLVLTPEGLKMMTEELEYLKNVRRVEVKEQIAIARSFGDLSENSEYDEAKNEQAKVESRIQELEQLLKNVVVVSEEDLNSGVVNLGTTVRVYDEEFDEEIEYNIVGTNEVDPLKNNISDQSPIGSALLGKKAEDVKYIPEKFDEADAKFLAKCAEEAGLDGIVCSPLEAGKVHDKCGKKFLTVTPGVRFADGDVGDQKRVMTPAAAKEIGSDCIVVGRPITAAADPVAAYERCMAEFCD